MGRGARRKLQFRPSLPIPIKKCSSGSQSNAGDATCTDRTSEYDWATWRMYTRITTARRLRAHHTSSSIHSLHEQLQQLMTITQDDIGQERLDPQVDPIMNPRGLQQQPLLEDELLDGEVFILDSF